MRKKYKPWHQPGEPIPREIQARMTQPKVHDPLYQVFVDIVGKQGVALPVLPQMNKEAAETACLAFNKASLDASRRQPGDWFNARAVCMQPLAS
jgi:hypothetical protein